MDQDITKYVTIQCRTKEFKIHKSYLESLPDSMLAKRFLNSNFNNDNYIDRDPELFKLIIDYYYDKKLIIPFNIPYDRVKLEFEFFCLEPVNIFIENINDNWKRNDIIKQIESTLDELVFSESFQYKILNTIGFSIDIERSDKLFNILNGDKTHDIAKTYLKNKFNLKSSIKFGPYNEKIIIEFIMNYYYGPERLK